MIKIKSNATYVYRCSGETILPGINFVKNEKFFDHPSVKTRVELGVLEVLDEVKTAKETKKENSLLEYFLNLNVRKFTTEIKSIYNLALLEEILKRDERMSVQKACEEQIKKLKGPEDAQ